MSREAVSLEARTDTVRRCPRCDEAFDMPQRGPGRRPIWCSPRCRRLASAERAAARNAGAAVQVVEVPRAHRPDPHARLELPSMHTLERLFLSSDHQCRELLSTLLQRYTDGELSTELRTAMEAFGASISQHHTLTKDPDYQVAMYDVRRLREHLRFEAQHAADRQRELSALRAELITKYTVIAQLRSDLARLQAPQVHAYIDTPIIAPGDAGPSPQLSRQQRRAAQRSAHKNRQDSTG